VSDPLRNFIQTMDDARFSLVKRTDAQKLEVIRNLARAASTSANVAPAATVQSGEAVALDIHERNALNEAVKLLPSISALKTLRDKLLCAPQPAQTPQVASQDDERAAFAELCDDLFSHAANKELSSGTRAFANVVALRLSKILDRAASPQSTATLPAQTDRALTENQRSAIKQGQQLAESMGYPGTATILRDLLNNGDSQ
jgi:hypothetical protein